VQKQAAALLLPSLLLTGVLLSCGTLLHRSYDFEDVTKARASDQTYFEDSSGVFFVEYFNPFPDKELLWFSSFIDGPVKLCVFDTATDSLETIYHFEEQEMPVYTIALHHEETARFVKCVVYVDGRPKCAKIYHAFFALPQPQWKTIYTVEER
jgi:hypothetical protein